MPFTVCVATDFFGQKVNFELDFPYAPSLPELTSTTQAAFTAESQARRPGSPVFQVSKFHVVDAVTDDWVEVVGAHQLRHQCQVYAFQPHSTRYTESQGHIPPATKPMAYNAQASTTSTYRPPMSASPLPRTDYSTTVPATTYGSASSHDAYRPPASQAPPQLPPVTAVPGAPIMPDNAAHDEKVRVMFEQTDNNHNRVIEQEELKRIMTLVHMDFSTLTIEDLFRKADHDRDGVINFPEWQRFAELYPTLFDSLYYRLKSYWDMQASEAQVDAARMLRGQLENNERAAKDTFDRSQVEAEDAGRRLADADRNAQDASGRQRAAEDAARDGVRYVDQAKQEKADRERDLAAERERERQAQQRAQEAARDLDAAQRRLAGVQQGLSDAEAAERRAAQALHDAQRERERQQALADQAHADMQRAADRHNQMMNDVPRTLEDAAARLQAAEQALLAADARHRELGACASDAAAAAAEAARQRDELGRILQNLRDRQEPARAAWLDAQRGLEDHDRAIQELEAQLGSEREQRRMLDEQEKSLVEQEVRLREQRESLEEKEGALRDAHNTFFNNTTRSPGRQASRSPALAARSPVQPQGYGSAADTAHRPYSSPYSTGKYY